MKCVSTIESIYWCLHARSSGDAYDQTGGYKKQMLETRIEATRPWGE